MIELLKGGCTGAAARSRSCGSRDLAGRSDAIAILRDLVTEVAGTESSWLECQYATR